MSSTKRKSVFFRTSLLTFDTVVFEADTPPDAVAHSLGGGQKDARLFPFRDHARDDFCAGLRGLGLQAEMAPRGLPEEEIQTGRGVKSLGLITLPSGPIRWINIRKRSEYSDSIDISWDSDPRDDKIYSWYADFVVPDARLAGNQFGPWVLTIQADLQRGNSGRDGFVTAHLDAVRPHRDHACWVLTKLVRQRDGPGFLFRELGRSVSIPTKSQWDSYSAVARFILDADESGPSLVGNLQPVSPRLQVICSICEVSLSETEAMFGVDICAICQQQRRSQQG